MKFLSSPLATAAAATQTGFAEILDFYLKSSITTPYGSTSVIRITNKPGGYSFFTPQFDPEPPGTQGDAATYTEWPVKRGVAKASAKFMSDRMTLNVSNVTGEWSDMLDDVEWQDTPVVIRKVDLTNTSPTANDCAVLFTGKVDAVRVDLKTLQFTCSNDFATFSTRRPAEDMHIGCRFRFGDDMCGRSRFHPDNLKPKTVAAGSTTTRLLATLAGHSATAVTASSTTDKITATAHGLSDSHRVRFSAATMPGGLTTGTWYFLRDTGTNDFKLAGTAGGSALDLTSNGSSVVMESETGFTEDTGTKAYVAQSVTADASTDKVSLTSHGLANGDRVKFGGTAVPGGLTAGLWYYVVSSATNDFKVAATSGGSAINLTSNGTAVTLDSTAPYGTDEINALADGNIAASSEQSPYEGYRVKSAYAAGWRFSSTPTNATASADLVSPQVDLDVGGVGYALKGWRFTADTTGPDWQAKRQVTIYWSDDAVNYLQVLTATLAPARNNVNAPDYELLTISVAAHRYWRVQFKKLDGSPFLGSVIGKVKAYDNVAGTGTDRIDALSDSVPSSVCFGSDEVAGHEAVHIQASLSGTWEVNVDGTTPEDLVRYDWGNNRQGYWEIPAAQAGLANHLLKPYLTFDLGSAKALKLWRIRSLPNVERADIPRIVQIFSSTNNFAAATHELNYELPPTPNTWSDLLIHNASSARYWRICIRNNWAEQLSFKMMAEVRAYAVNRNYWGTGRVTFASDTPTVALRNVSRAVVASYSGAVDLAALPATPAAGDRFLLERGCNRSLNACFIHRNETNFGGFAELPKETVVRA